MSPSRWDVGSGLAMLAIALAASTTLPAAERHNFILLVPEILPAASVEDRSAPTLTRLRTEGINFVNSHSGFPSLVVSDSDIAADFKKESLMEAVEAAQYSALYIHGIDAQPTVIEQLRRLKDAGRPFLLIYRISDNSTREADDALAAIEASLRSLGSLDDTNIIVAAERGSSVVWKGSRSSASLHALEDEDAIGEMPTGFLAIDVVAAMQDADPKISLFDPDQGNKALDWVGGEHPLRGNAIIGTDPTDPRVVIEARGGHDFIYLPARLSKQEATRAAKSLVEILLEQDYISGIFVNEKRVGRIRGALSHEHLGWGGAVGVPDIAVNFASVHKGCQRPMTCTVMIADTPLEEGEAIQGAFSRADTWTFMAARGPDFQKELIDRLPASNTDVSRTILELVQPVRKSKLKFPGRPLIESLRGNESVAAPVVRNRIVASKPSEEGLVTEVLLQSVGSVQYFDAAGFPGWTVGIQFKDAPERWQWDLPWPRSMSVTISPD